MRIDVIAVGRAKRGPAQDLFATYAERIERIGPALGFRSFTLTEIADARAASRSERQSREAEAIVASMPRGATMFALDERGDALSSQEFARLLATQRDRGAPSSALVIGGPDGLAEDLRQKAVRVLSFGRQTWPHLLIRAMLAEQVYRSLTIIGRHPYHRD